MKHLKFSFIAVIIVMLFSSCGKEILDENPDEPLKKGKKKQVSLVINEDITVSEMSLFVPKSRAVKQKLYAVNVFQKKPGQAEFSKFAYGLFDDSSKMNIVLDEENTYSFECLIVEEGEDAVFNSTEGYMAPFLKGTKMIPTKLENKFVKSSSVNFSNLSGVQTQISEAQKVWSPRMIKQYGKSEEFAPKTADKVKLATKCTVFGVRLVVAPPEEGTLEVTFLEDYVLTITSKDPKYDHASIYSFATLEKAIEEGYNGKFYFILKWTKADGTIKTENRTIVMKRNVMTKVNIEVKNPDPKDFSIIEDSAEMSEETIDWIFKG